MKKRRNIVILILALLIILILFFCVRCSQLGGTPNNAGTLGNGGAGTNSPIVFADPVFEKLLKAELGKEQIAP